ncbi:MAG: hypothetical protein K0Q73_7882 [Paenibacillus sp.]|jgi:hypothetical protein|nr:hypothetical protein [Paenibacillus sp.]
MEKTTRKQEDRIGGFDESILDDLNPSDPNFIEEYIKRITSPIEEEKDDKK